MFRLQIALAGGLFACGISATSPAAAGPKEDADRLFAEALADLDAGRWDAACPKFRASQTADPSVGTLLNVAACSEHEGHIEQALAEYQEVLRLNAATRDPKRRASVEASAREAIALVEKKMPSLVVKVVPADARVEIDGVPRPAGEAVRLPSGKHEVRVSRDGFDADTRPVALAEAEHGTIEITLSPAATRAPATSTPDRTLALAGWITGGAGIAVGAGGAALLGLAGARASEIEDVCRNDSPPACYGDAARANELSREGRAFRDAGLGLAITGGAAIGAGALLLVLDATGASSEARTALALAPSLGPAGGGL
ncbi:MAG TPA: PEGA domain-containing protein, partial [Polyangiaceae bacterium]|nr:PEGA domain-containing protein [Polyangiaceae bacterium]